MCFILLLSAQVPYWPSKTFPQFWLCSYRDSNLLNGWFLAEKKLTFLGAKSVSSKNIVKNRPGFLSLNSLYAQLHCSGCPSVFYSRMLRSIRHSCRNWFRASCVRNFSMFSLFWFPTFWASQRVYWSLLVAWNIFDHRFCGTCLKISPQYWRLIRSLHNGSKSKNISVTLKVVSHY